MKAPSVESMEFRGGRLCLDFVNTANWPDGKPVDERLVDLDAVRIWVGRKGLAETATLEGDLCALLQLREAVRRIIVQPGKVNDDDLAILNEARARAAPLGHIGKRLRIDAGTSIDWIARTIADSTAELVLTTDRLRIKTCHGERCGWLFLDESPNNRRRWCSMADCGNRAKAKRHYDTRKKRLADAA